MTDAGVPAKLHHLAGGELLSHPELYGLEGPALPRARVERSDLETSDGLLGVSLFKAGHAAGSDPPAMRNHR